jgi:hypothetical protein
MRPPTTDTEPKPKKQSKLKPMQSHDTVEPEPTRESPDILQLQHLLERIPIVSTGPADDITSRIAPVLDRILCTVSDMGLDRCSEVTDHPCIVELFQRLFGLIDIDDFLTRVIVCRILLGFARDRTSPLLLPMAKIFFKLSCEPMNIEYFVEESLEIVLLTLIRTGTPEVQFYAAQALVNLADDDQMREKLSQSDLFAVSFDLFHDRVPNEDLKEQILKTVKKMCRNDNFRGRIAESHFLSMAANCKRLYCDVLRIVARVPEMSVDEKADFLDAFSRIQYTNERVIRDTIDALRVVAESIEDTENCAQTINKLLNACGSDPDDLLFLLSVAQKCLQNRGILQTDTIYRTIAEFSDVDTSIRRLAIAIMTDI